MDYYVVALLKKRSARGGTNGESLSDDTMMSMSDAQDGFPRGETIKTLSFDEFANKGGNFHMFFAPEESMMGDEYRSKAVFQECLAAHPELKLLAAELQGYDFEEFDIDEKTGAVIIKPSDQKRAEMMHKLYDAYLLMKPYAKRSGDLFG